MTRSGATLFPLALLLAATLAACGEGEAAKPTAAEIARAETLRPADPALAAVYERSCMTCHGVDGGGAPLTGHAAGWAPRLRKGPAVLLASSRQGLNQMPPMGLCEDCSDAQLKAMIDFMSGTSR